MLCGTAPGTTVAQNTAFSLGTLTRCSPNFSQTSLSTRTAWNPQPFLEIGLDLIWYHLSSANRGATFFQAVNNGARPAGIYQVNNQDNFFMVLRFQKNILP